jgi:uncharacterized protein
MTAQEQQMLQGLTDRINQTQLAEKDADAEQTLQQTLGRNPDALYILAQTVLVQQYALEQAQKQLADARTQIEQLRQQAPPPQAPPVRHATSFLGNLLGLKEDEPARPAAPPPQSQYAPVQGYQPVPGYQPPPGYVAAPGYGAPGYGVGPPYGVPGGYGAPQQGGFLRSAVQTAAGVAAGALAFEGIESLMHGFGHEAGYGGGFGSGFGGLGEGGRPEEIVNNYYGDAVPGAEHSEHSERSDLLSSSGDRGVSDREADSGRFSDAVYRDDRGAGSSVVNAPGDDGLRKDELDNDDASGDASSSLDAAAGDVPDDSGDTSSFDDSNAGMDDGGGFDSGGSDDSGGGDGNF